MCMRIIEWVHRNLFYISRNLNVFFSRYCRVGNRSKKEYIFYGRSFRYMQKIVFGTFISRSVVLIIIKKEYFYSFFIAQWVSHSFGCFAFAFVTIKIMQNINKHSKHTFACVERRYMFVYIYRRKIAPNYMLLTYLPSEKESKQLKK